MDSHLRFTVVEQEADREATRSSGLHKLDLDLREVMARRHIESTVVNSRSNPPTTSAARTQHKASRPRSGGSMTFDRRLQTLAHRRVFPPVSDIPPFTEYDRITLG